MTRHRSLVLVASAPKFCVVCHGSQRVRLRQIPDGAWIDTNCPHCVMRTPIAYLPTRPDRSA